MNHRYKSFILSILLFISCEGGVGNRNDKKMISKSDIFSELTDLSNPYKFFPDLNHGYVYLVTNRINLFGDDSRWAIVMEVTGYNNRSNNCELELYYFGNCLENLDSVGNGSLTTNMKIFILSKFSDLEKISHDFELISSTVDSVIIRGENIAIEHDKNKYLAKGIEFYKEENPDGLIDYSSLFRYLNEVHSELFHATKFELYSALPQNLDFIMRIDNWYYEPYNNYSGMPVGTKPEDNETFQLISDILISKDTTLYKPKMKPNNNWRNWPESGNL